MVVNNLLISLSLFLVKEKLRLKISVSNAKKPVGLVYFEI